MIRHILFYSIIVGSVDLIAKISYKVFDIKMFSRVKVTYVIQKF